MHIWYLLRQCFISLCYLTLFYSSKYKKKRKRNFPRLRISREMLCVPYILQIGCGVNHSSSTLEGVVFVGHLLAGFQRSMNHWFIMALLVSSCLAVESTDSEGSVSLKTLRTTRVLFYQRQPCKATILHALISLLLPVCHTRVLKIQYPLRCFS